MKPVYIPQLIQAPNQTVQFEVEDYLPDLETLTPVKGQVSVTHQGNYLEVKAQAAAIATLNCHRCLENYNARVRVDNSELIWLESPPAEEAGSEREVELDDLVETLPPQGYFDPQKWLYEQMCLALPQRQICDLACAGIAFENPPEAAQSAVDHRWAALSDLKQQLSGQ